MQYPYDAEAKCHKGFAFVVLNRNADVETCLAKKYRSWFYVEGPRSQAGFDSRGRCFLRLRPAHIEAAHAKEEDTHLILTPASESSESRVSIGLRDFKLHVEEIVRSLGVTIVKSEGELDGNNKYVHLHTRDAESAAVVKMFVNNFKENDVLVKVRYARKPKASKAAPVVVLADAKEPAVQAAPKLVLEPITENYGRFGIPYAQVVKSGPASAAAPAARADATYATSLKQLTTVAHVAPAKGKAKAHKPATKSNRLAGTA